MQILVADHRRGSVRELEQRHDVRCAFKADPDGCALIADREVVVFRNRASSPPT